MIAVIAVSIPMVMADGANAEDVLLLDGGNGVTDWYGLGDGVYGEVLSEALASDGIELILDDGIVIDGKGEMTIGHVTSQWRVYGWTGGSWSDITDEVDMSAAYTGGAIALGFYPEGVLPTETPDYRTSWTMIRGDTLSSGHQDAVLGTGDYEVDWAYHYGSSNFVCSTILVEGPHAYVVDGGGHSAKSDPTLYCYDRFTGEELWSFKYERSAGYETATGAIVGGHIYIPASNYTLYKIPLTGPGEGYCEVESLEIPRTIDHDVIGTLRSTGPASVTYDSGTLYFVAADAYTYCVDLDLDVIWKSPMGGRGYYMSPTVYDGVVYAGALDGCLYAFDQCTGELIDSVKVFTITKETSVGVREYGSVLSPVIVDDILVMSYSDGQGMDTMEGGVAAYRLTSSGLEQVFDCTGVGVNSNYLVPVDNDGFTGVYTLSYDGLVRISLDGSMEVLRGFNGDAFKAPLTLVNGDTLFAVEYEAGGDLYMMDLEGKILGQVKHPEEIWEWTMTGLVVVDGMVLNGTDGGAFAFSGKMPSPASSAGWGTLQALAAVIVVLVVLFVVLCLWVKRTKGEPPVQYIIGRLRQISGFNNDRTSKVKRNKRRLVTVLIIGSILGFVLFLISLALGPSGNYGLGESLSILASAIVKTFSGEPLTYDETIIFDSRCSRAVAAFVVGIGLSISGSIYQAIIRNPMVDPYIMGVSSGAGVAAVAAIAFDFTFFGLLGDVTYATPIVAMIGGLIAFGTTMLLAEKAGGSSVNYVLGGIIVGLVFSAIQTLLLSMAGDKLNSAMSWLFGSFANISWEQTIIMAIPAIALSIVPLIWAKEFNLVLLGEDQARQMGLDVFRFNRWMLILASVLAAVCVAFVGIIGFVGLVVPHLCRMILGGDHRLVMPASMVVGGALMLAADLFSKMVMIPMELPVGAITTVIGAPVFAYLLIKKGRMYDG